MQAKTGSVEQGRTFTEGARRAQIVAAAIETIAEVGYAKASFARIAKRAGLSSTGMISYHFAGKDDLMTAVVEDVTATAVDHVRPRIDAVTGYAAKLRARIESNVELLGRHPAAVRALVEIMTNARDADGDPVQSPPVVAGSEGLIEQHLRSGQAAGEFGAFDPRVTAIAVQSAIDGLVGRGGTPDLDAAGRELADLFDRATRP